MPKPPRRYSTDDATQRLVNEYTPYLKSLYVPAEAVRGVVGALLKRIPARNLNYDAAVNHLMAELLHDNKTLEEAEERSGSYVIDEGQSPKEAATSEMYLASLPLGDLGDKRVDKVLQEYSHHSADQMRAESDEVLAAISADPFSNYSVLSDWANVNLPKLLRSLKSKQACSSGCPSNTKWPPDETSESNSVLPPDNDKGIYGAALVKNHILAYFHGLSVSHIQNYLEGRRPKV